jgi:hypothetical protein
MKAPIYKKKDDGKDKPPREHADAPNDAGDDKPKGEEGDGEGGDLDMEIKERESLHKQHESERRDFHGNHLEAMRLMNTRHEKAIRELHKAQMERMMEPKEPDAGEAPKTEGASE